MKKAVILMAYGTPRTINDVEAYYTHIRGGRKPSDADLQNLVDRYKAIGGASPLIRLTESVGEKLERRLRASGSQTLVYTAMKHSPPFISDVVKRAAESGVDQALAIVLAPHFSTMSTGAYMLAVELANDNLPKKMKIDSVPSWYDRQPLIDAWARRVREASMSLPKDYALIFSAHSLPESILVRGDPYRDQLLETSRLVAAAVGREEWSFAFQSASHTSEPWLGPDILEHMQSLFEQGKRSFLIAPVGFVSDHLEILYDIDVECRQWANDRGVQLERCKSLNDSEEFINCLYSLVEEKEYT